MEQNNRQNEEPRYDPINEGQQGQNQNSSQQTQQQEQRQAEPAVVHSKRMKAGNKDYFFDVKKSKTGINYAQITESWKTPDGKWIRSRVTIFRDHFREFADSVNELDQYL